MYVAGWYRQSPSDPKPMAINLAFDNSNSLTKFMAKPEELFSDTSAFTAATYWEYSRTKMQKGNKRLFVMAKRDFISSIQE